MTNEEALDWLIHKISIDVQNSRDIQKDIECLETCEKALEMRISKKPESQHHCPCCGSGLPVPELTIPEARQYIDFYPKFCPDCGQAIAWKGETK